MEEPSSVREDSAVRIIFVYTFIIERIADIGHSDT